MKNRGTLIAVEGIDGSGKQTQTRLLARELESRGYQVLPTGFPQYGSWFGKMVGQFLNGDLGPLNSVDPHFAALLYAGNRFEGKQPIVETMERGGVVIADRYIVPRLDRTSRVCDLRPSKRGSGTLSTSSARAGSAADCKEGRTAIHGRISRYSGVESRPLESRRIYVRRPFSSRKLGNDRMLRCRASNYASTDRNFPRNLKCGKSEA
jgi:hypothetical protein